MSNKELAKIDPSKVYARPRDILGDESLIRVEKIDILQRWAYDERELSVAEEENMQAFNPRNILDEINKCLLQLGVDSTDGSHPPTKQG
jgi:hypothetical protein